MGSSGRVSSGDLLITCTELCTAIEVDSMGDDDDDDDETGGMAGVTAAAQKANVLDEVSFTSKLAVGVGIGIGIGIGRIHQSGSGGIGQGESGDNRTKEALGCFRSGRGSNLGGFGGLEATVQLGGALGSAVAASLHPTTAASGDPAAEAAQLVLHRFLDRFVERQVDGGGQRANGVIGCLAAQKGGGICHRAPSRSQSLHQRFGNKAHRTSQGSRDGSCADEFRFLGAGWQGEGVHRHQGHVVEAVALSFQIILGDGQVVRLQIALIDRLEDGRYVLGGALEVEDNPLGFRGSSTAWLFSG